MNQTVVRSFVDGDRIVRREELSLVQLAQKSKFGFTAAKRKILHLRRHHEITKEQAVVLWCDIHKARLIT